MSSLIALELARTLAHAHTKIISNNDIVREICRAYMLELQCMGYPMISQTKGHKSLESSISRVYGSPRISHDKGTKDV